MRQSLSPPSFHSVTTFLVWICILCLNHCITFQLISLSPLISLHMAAITNFPNRHLDCGIPKYYVAWVSSKIFHCQHIKAPECTQLFPTSYGMVVPLLPLTLLEISCPICLSTTSTESQTGSPASVSHMDWFCDSQSPWIPRLSWSSPRTGVRGIHPPSLGQLFNTWFPF